MKFVGRDLRFDLMEKNGIYSSLTLAATNRWFLKQQHLQIGRTDLKVERAVHGRGCVKTHEESEKIV